MKGFVNFGGGFGVDVVKPFRISNDETGRDLPIRRAKPSKTPQKKRAFVSAEWLGSLHLRY